MIGNKDLITSLKHYKRGNVSFGDGASARICGKGIVESIGMPKLDGVLYVAGLREKIYEHKLPVQHWLEVNFSKEERVVVINLVNMVMKTIYNSYEILA